MATTGPREAALVAENAALRTQLATATATLETIAATAERLHHGDCGWCGEIEGHDNTCPAAIAAAALAALARLNGAGGGT